MSNSEQRIGKVVARAVREPDFRDRLVSDPRRAFEDELGAALPEGVSVRIVQAAPGEAVIVLPPPDSEYGEISDEELDAIAGGGHGTFGSYGIVNTALMTFNS